MKALREIFGPNHSMHLSKMIEISLYDKKLANDGFAGLYLNFYDGCLKIWYAKKYAENESSILTLNEEGKLGEELIYQDVMANNLERLKMVRIGNDPKLFFNYLTEEQLQEIGQKMGRRSS